MIDCDECDTSSDEAPASGYSSSSDKNENEIYSRDIRRKIVEYWWNNGQKRKFSSIQRKFKKLMNRNEKLLYTWKVRLASDKDFSYIFIILLYYKCFSFYNMISNQGKTEGKC